MSAVAVRAAQLGYGSEVVFGPSDLDVPEATSVALIGPNGAGKSTLLDALAGLRRPRAGTVEVFGHEPGQVRRRIAYVVQSASVSARLPVTVQEVVTMGCYGRTGLLGRLGAADRARVAQAMERLGVAGLARRRLDELSGGQRQRVFVAQGLVQQADLLLLDEPVTGLDLVSRQVILDVVRDEVARGTTVVLSTHDLGEARLVGQLVLLAGRVVASGPPEDVLTEACLEEAYGARFLQVGGKRVLVDEVPHTHGHSH